MNLFTETNLPIQALAPSADLYNTNPATDVVNLAKYDKATFLVYEGAGGTGTATITVEECTAADGTGATAIAFNYRLNSTDDTFGALTAVTSTGYTTVAGANKIVAIEVNADDLSDGSNFVRLQLTEVVNAPVTGAVIGIMSKPRYAEDVLPTALS